MHIIVSKVEGLGLRVAFEIGKLRATKELYGIRFDPSLRTDENQRMLLLFDLTL